MIKRGSKTKPCCILVRRSEGFECLRMNVDGFGGMTKGA